MCTIVQPRVWLSSYDSFPVDMPDVINPCCGFLIRYCGCYRCCRCWRRLWLLILNLVVLVIVTFVSVFCIRRSKSTSAAKTLGILMVKILNKCILSILVYNLFQRQTAQYFHKIQYFHTPVYWLSSWNRNSFF